MSGPGSRFGRATPASASGSRPGSAWSSHRRRMPIPRCVDDGPPRARELEDKGVEFSGDIIDTGVCHMAFFTDPDGNDLMLHHRYAPYE